jgi:glycosidase
MAKRLHIPQKVRWNMIKKTTRDNARTPMQWNDGPNAGFTAGEPWLPINPNYTYINMKSQIDNPDSIRNFYKTVIKLRAESDVLKYGNFEAVRITKNLFAYKRTYGEQSLIIALNFSPRPQKFDCGGEVILSNYKTGISSGVLKPYEAVIIKA